MYIYIYRPGTVDLKFDDLELLLGLLLFWLLVEVVEEVVLGLEGAALVEPVKEVGHTHDGAQTEQHAHCLKGEVLRAMLFIIHGVLDGRGQVDHGLPTRQSEDERYDVPSDGAVGVGEGQVDDTDELGEGHHVHHVRAQHEQVIDGLDGDGDQRGKGTDSHDADPHCPQDLALGCLQGKSVEYLWFH